MKILKYKKQSKNILISYHPDYLIAVNYLISKWNEEVAWYGTLSYSKRDDGTMVFQVNPELIIPEQVTAGSNVQSDDPEGELIKPSAISRALEEDYPDESERDEFNNRMKLHGHSHVNMGVSWSTEDQKHYEEISQNLPYFIGHIANKKGLHGFYYHDSEIPDMDSNEPFTNFPTIEYTEVEFYSQISNNVAPMMDHPQLLSYVDKCLKNRVKKQPINTYQPKSYIPKGTEQKKLWGNYRSFDLRDEFP